MDTGTNHIPEVHSDTPPADSHAGSSFTLGAHEIEHQDTGAHEAHHDVAGIVETIEIPMEDHSHHDH
ncbi:MAG: hypothetical protein NTZ60_01970 [Campylobacterales bacterium]|nr:hypothetical protein [Campylobacterales bacterium]